MYRHRLLLSSAVFACVTVSSLHAATADDTTATQRADFLKGRVIEQIKKFDEKMAEPNPKPSVRDLSLVALAKMYLGDVHGAEALLRHMFTVQNMDTASPSYGMVPWQEGNAAVNDGNSVDFTMLPFAQIMVRFGNQLSPEFKQEALPHLKAAIAGIRFRNAAVAYTNIYLMQAASLLLLGEAINDQGAINEGKKDFENWIELTQKVGITEFDSTTYTPVQVGCLQIAYDNTKQEDLKPRLKACMDYFWSDIAANYYEPHQHLSGPQSRCYNFLEGDENLNQFYYLVGLRDEIPGETLISDDIRIWSDAATPNGYKPAASILELAKLPERTIYETYGKEPGQDRYNFITPDFAFGTASSYIGGQDKEISMEFGTTKKLPFIEIAPDDLDAPYGKIKANDKSGHAKPHRLKVDMLGVQEKGTSLAMLDLAPRNGQQGA